jgi:folate-dependent phosphoribosylglycinamide formyltransferase PurN
VVFQDYAHYNLTARENIGFGNVNQLFDDEIRLAVQKAGADKAIASLAYGYDTILGKEFEEGEELSILTKHPSLVYTASGTAPRQELVFQPLPRLASSAPIP